MEEGIVAGGGVALIRQKALDAAEVCGDEAVGVHHSQESEALLRQLVENAGLEAALIVENVRTARVPTAVNVATGEYTDLVKAGVFDPAGSRAALQNAASIAGLLPIYRVHGHGDSEKKESDAEPGHGRHGHVRDESRQRPSRAVSAARRRVLTQRRRDEAGFRTARGRGPVGIGIAIGIGIGIDYCDHLWSQ